MVFISTSCLYYNIPVTGFITKLIQLMYYSDTFKSDKKTVTLAINEFRKRGPAEISTVVQICYSCQVNLSVSCNRYKGDSLSQQ